MSQIKFAQARTKIALELDGEALSSRSVMGGMLLQAAAKLSEEMSKSGIQFGF